MTIETSPPPAGDKMRYDATPTHKEIAVPFQSPGEGGGAVEYPLVRVSPPEGVVMVMTFDEDLVKSQTEAEDRIEVDA